MLFSVKFSESSKHCLKDYSIQTSEILSCILKALTSMLSFKRFQIHKFHVVLPFILIMGKKFMHSPHIRKHKQARKI